MPRLKLAATLTLLTLCLLLPASAQALPRGFFGIETTGGPAMR